jgi:hypothetical protein
MTHTRLENTARRDVWRIEVLVIVRLSFQLGQLFEKETARGEPNINCAQQSLRNADVAIPLCVDA